MPGKVRMKQLSFGKYLFSALVLCAGMLFMSAAMAQNCSTERDLIFQLAPQTTGSYNIWDSAFGDADRQEVFRAGLTIDEGHLLLAGESYVFAGGQVELLLAQMERRGRVVWHQRHVVPGLRSVRDVIRIKDGYLVLGQRKESSAESMDAWLGFFDSKGNLTSEKIVKEEGTTLLAQDITSAGSTGNFLLAATTVPDSASPYGTIYTLDARGETLSRRSINPGLENAIQTLVPDGKGGVFAAGFIRAEDGRRTGWVLRLDAKGTLLWQQQYPRGRAALLSRIAPYKGNSIVAVGRAFPGTGGTSAGWVMMLSTTDGKLIWQRYYTDDMNEDARDVLVGAGDLFSVLLSSEKSGQAKRKDYVRILSITSLGSLFSSDEYFNAQGAQGYRLLEGTSGARLVIGSTLNTHIDPAALPANADNQNYGPPRPGEKMAPKAASIKPDPAVEGEPAKIRSLDGWVVAGTATEPYRDPCVRAPGADKN